MKIFNPDSPFMTVLSRIGDMVILNILTGLLCIPVITAGAAFTAQYYVMLKIRRDEDSGTIKLFFRSFRENFRQATVIWLITIFAIGLPIVLLKLIQGFYADAAPTYIKVLLSGAVLLAAFLLVMAFPALSRFDGTVASTIKTSIVLAVSNPPRTFLIIILLVAPFYLTYNFPVILPVLILFGFSLPSFLAVLRYNKQFSKLGAKSNEADGIPVPGSEDEHIFNDEISGE